MPALAVVLGCLMGVHRANGQTDTAIFDDTTAVETGENTVSLPHSADTIRAIRIVGNTHTRESVIKLFLAVDTGSVLDTGALDAAENRLRATNIFFSVKILRLNKANGVELLVVLQEMPRLMITDLGGELHNRRYEKSDILWNLWNLHCGVKFNNIGGALESVQLGLSFWEWRSISLSWYKPILPSPYTLSIGFSASEAPYEYMAWRYYGLSGRASLARKMGDHGSVFGGVRGFANKTVYKGPALVGTYDTIRSPTYHDSVTGVTWNADPRYDTNQSVRRYNEMFALAGFSESFVNTAYPCSQGWSFASQIGANIPFTHIDASHFFVQWDSDFKLYHPVLWQNNSFAYRVQATLRDEDGGRFHRVVAGSNGSIRGYPGGGLGAACEANNRVLGSFEYRFPIINTPAIDLPLISDLYPPLHDFYFRYDGALFADAGYLWNQVQHPLTRYEIGFSAGAGIRLTAPSMRRAASFDVVPVLRDPETGLPRFYWWPGWELYVDMSF